MNQIFGIAATCLLGFSNAVEVAYKIIFLPICGCCYRVKFVGNLAYRPSQKA
ncbi:hypothetical protein KR52_08460 [Synechococcus sp. KORDI-52]|nr:hypothetical protein KR52_08460 [Synechococcus sp. KORDI-52]